MPIVYALFLIGLNACGNHSTTNKADQGKNTLVIGNGAGEVPTLDPGKWSDTTSLRVLHDLFEGLVFENQKDEVLPGIAKSWDISKDGKTYIFHLRDDAKWSNGKSVTAQDFVYAFKRNINPKTGAQQLDVFRPIVNANAIIAGKKSADTLAIKALNKNTLEIKLAYPYPYFIPSLLNPITYPLYRPAIEKWGNGWIQVGKMVSNGPYELKQWIPNGHILVSKNPHYWQKDKVKIQNVKFMPMTPQAEYSQFMANQIDMTYTVPTGISKEQLKAQFGDEFYNVPMLGTYFYWFNMQAKGVDKLEVRKALTMSVDRKLIVDKILKLGQTPLYGQVPPQIQEGAFKDLYKEVAGYAWVDWSTSKRIQVAKGMLKKAGYSQENPLKITISFNTQDGHKLVAEAISEMWKKAFGSLIEVTLLNEEWKVYLQTLQRGNYQVGRMGGIATLNTAGNFVESYLCHNAGNYGGYCNKKLDQYYLQSMHSLKAKEADYYMKKALEISMGDYVTLPIYSYTYSRLVKRYVGGYHPKENYMDDTYSKWFYFK